MILDVGENEVSVLYADYGNSEKVPLSRILPIPARLLQLPFQIARCTLAGKAVGSTCIWNSSTILCNCSGLEDFTRTYPTCLLIGKEPFPAEWPQEAQQMFQAVVSDGVLAKVQYFDGSASVLSLTLPAERGGGNIANMILEALCAKTERSPCTTPTQKTDSTGSSTSISTAAAPDSSKSQPMPENQRGPISTDTLDTTAKHHEQKKNIPAASVSG